jgi:hypothetical protein
MRAKVALPALLCLTAGCAAHLHRGTSQLVLREKSPGLFVGHTDDGEVVVAASHYEAMNGLAVMDTDLGLQPRNDVTSGAMICQREVPTGSHVPHWACRYTDDIAHERQVVLNTLQQPWLSPSGSGGVGGGILGSGGGASHATQRR